MGEYKFTEDRYGNCQLQKKNAQKTGEWEQEMACVDPAQENATKRYVDDKIKEANPDFKGTFNSMADIEAIEDANANDWAYLVTQDENGNDVYSRYRYTVPAGATSWQWTFEVAIKRDNFTDEEWAAITSGITSGKVAKLDALPTNEELSQELAKKLENSDLADVIDTVAIADETNGDITIQYEDDEPEPQENNNNEE